MRVWLIVAGTLASLAVAEPARATPGLPGASAAVSDTDRTPRVHTRWRGPDLHPGRLHARAGVELVERCSRLRG